MPRLLLLLSALVFISGCGIGLCISETNCAGSGGLSLTTSSLTLRAVEIDDSEITVAWPAAAGGTAPYTYSLYYSTSANLDSIANIKANGTLAGTVVDDTSFQITALPIDKDYFFNVTVSDASGAELAYDMRTPFCGGTGVSGDEYQICDAGSLQYVHFHLSSRFLQTADIDLAGTSSWNEGLGFLPIGGGTAFFTGFFDGAGYSISSLHINRNTDFVGLFGFTDTPAELNNINVRNAWVAQSGPDPAGIVVGLATSTSLWNVHTSGYLSGTSRVGGVVGQADLTTITESSSSAYVSGTSYVGALAGDLTNSSQAIRSFASGNVTGTSDRIGGLIGEVDDSTVDNCYSTGNVHSAGNEVGGLVGRVRIAGSLIQRSYATGNVAGALFVGGLVGDRVSGTIRNSFAFGNVVGTGAAVIGQTGVAPTAPVLWFSHPFNTANCHSLGNGNCTARTNPTWFYDIANYDGGGGELNWDFTSSGAWIMPATGKYPVLRWQNPNRPIEFPPEFRNGRKIGFSDMAAYRVWGFCGTPGETIYFGGPNAPGNTTCNGGTFTTNWDFSGQSDGSIDITVQQGTATPVTRRLVKDTDSCNIALNNETATGTIDTRFGLSAGPHIVCNVQQMARLQAVAGNWTKTFVLGANIDLSVGYTNLPITSLGGFDGDGFVLSGLTINQPAALNVGLLGMTGATPVSKLGLENVNILGSLWVGAVAGLGAASNVYSTGYVRGNTDWVGGIIGLATGNIDNSFSSADIVGAGGGAATGGLCGICSSIRNSFAQGEVKGSGFVGGLAGSGSGAIENSFSSGAIASAYSDGGGGLAGTWSENVLNSYATGSVYCRSGHCGGVLGESGPVAARNLYSTGNVLSTGNAGGAIGYLVDGSLENVFVTGTASSTSVTGAMVATSDAPTTITNAFWKQPSGVCVGSSSGSINSCAAAPSTNSFNISSDAPLSSWDFSTVWKFPTTGGLPILQWQEED